MNIDLNKILALDDAKLAKFGLLVIAALLLFSPGALILFFEESWKILELNIYLLIVLCCVLSLPFHVLGIITYMHPYKTQEEVHHKIISGWGVILGAGVWSSITAVAAYGTVHGLLLKQPVPISQNIKILYVIAWGLQLAPMSLLFWLNSSKLLKNIRRES